VRQQSKHLPWGSKTYREVLKLTVGFKKLAWAATKKTYREIQKVSVGQQPKKLTVTFKNLPWGSQS